MGRAFTQTITAAGVGVDPNPISVSGCTIFYGLTNYEIAYDPADFASNQFFTMRLQLTNMSHEMIFPPQTILWVRLIPSSGEPATDLSVHTQITEVNA